MDFVLNRLNRLIEVSEKRTVEKQTLLRERVEYVLFLILGYLWNENFDDMDVEKKAKIVENLNRITIGEVVSAIRDLDSKKSFLSNKAFNIINRYPNIRNEALGHGYTHDDVEEELELQLDSLYKEISENLQYISSCYDLIKIQKIEEKRYVGFRFSCYDGGMPSKWSCPIELIEGENAIDSIYILIGENYHRISPFIAIENKGSEMYVFQSLVEKLSGNVKMSRLFNSGSKEFTFNELITISNNSERRRISANGTIMNYFETNYTNYIPITIEKNIKDFLLKNRSNVLSTVWGHGGVGKTACIQNICMGLFNLLIKKLSYIVFLSAKDRLLDPKSGKIIEIANLRTYNEMLAGIVSVLFDEDMDVKTKDILSYEQRIYDNSGNILLVVDDYETFPEMEKKKIQDFINNLNIDHFKVIITTRNKRLSSGINISTNELDYGSTKNFLLAIFSNDYPEQYDNAVRIVNDDAVMQKIHEATSGRAIFLYQFANLYVQKGYKDDLLVSLKSSKNAQDFLYGRIYSYLSEGAKKVFVCISQITDEKDFIFKGRVLEYLVREEDSEDTIQFIEELVDQKVIEQYDNENYRVYSKELFKMMLNAYEEMANSFKDTIKSKLADIGGKDIKGTVYEAMLTEANLSRTNGNAKETVEKYRRLLNDKKCDKNVKKKTLINLVSYINIDLMNVDEAIKVLGEYRRGCGFESNVEITKIYAMILWASDSDGKQKACDTLERFFKDRLHKKTAYKNLELFSLAVSYCINNVLSKKDDFMKPENIRNKQRLYNEYGKELFDYVCKKQLSEFRPALKHNFSTALIQTAYLCLDLAIQSDDKLEYAKKIVEYGTGQFNEIFKSSLKKINSQIAERQKKKCICIDYKIGEIVYATVAKVKSYGAIVLIGKSEKSILHISQIADRKIENIYKELHENDEIKVRIIDKTVEGYKVSMKI